VDAPKRRRTKYGRCNYIIVLAACGF